MPSDRQTPRSIFSSPLKTAVRASWPEVSVIGIHLMYLAPNTANLEEGSNSECVNDAMRNYILLFGELLFYFDTEKHISKRHRRKEFNTVLALCAPCEHSLCRNLCSGKAAQY